MYRLTMFACMCPKQPLLGDASAGRHYKINALHAGHSRPRLSRLASTLCDSCTSAHSVMYPPMLDAPLQVSLLSCLVLCFGYPVGCVADAEGVGLKVSTQHGQVLGAMVPAHPLEQGQTQNRRDGQHQQQQGAVREASTAHTDTVMCWSFM
jgi:hypothetical protein